MQKQINQGLNESEGSAQQTPTIRVDQWEDEITIKLFIDNTLVSTNFEGDGPFFGFVNLKLSSLCINGGKFLYPGQAFSVFVGSQAETLVKKHLSDISKPIGVLYIRSEYTPEKNWEEGDPKAEGAVAHLGELNQFQELKSQLKQIEMESAIKEEKIDELENQIEEYSNYIQMMTQEFNESIR